MLCSLMGCLVNHHLVVVMTSFINGILGLWLVTAGLGDIVLGSHMNHPPSVAYTGHHVAHPFPWVGFVGWGSLIVSYWQYSKESGHHCNEKGMSRAAHPHGNVGDVLG